MRYSGQHAMNRYVGIKGIVHDLLFEKRLTFNPGCQIDNVPESQVEFFIPDSLAGAIAKGFEPCIHCLPFEDDAIGRRLRQK